MPKIYTKNTWTDEQLVEGAEYSIDGGDPVTIELTTDVAVAGTGVTAERMNNIEDGIDGLDDKIIDVEDRLDGFEDSALDTEIPELTDKVRGLDDPGGTPISVTFLLSAVYDLFKTSYDAVYASLTGTQTLTNKRITPRVVTVTVAAEPAINTDNGDALRIGVSGDLLDLNITSLTTNLTGTPTHGQTVIIEFLDDGTPRTIAHGASFRTGSVAPLSTTTASKLCREKFMWDSADSVWDIMATWVEA